MPKRGWFEYKPISELSWFVRLCAPVMRFWGRLRHWDWSRHEMPDMKELHEIVADFGGPVVGLLDEYRDLKQFGMGYGGDSVELSFRAGPAEEPTIGVRLETRLRQERPRGIPAEVLRQSIEVHLRMVAYGMALTCGTQAFRQSQIQNIQSTDPMQWLSNYPVEIVTGVRLSLKGFSDPTEAWRWQVERVVHAFFLEGETHQLLVCTSGFETPELPLLFAHIGAINGRADVIERYERENKEAARPA